MAARIAKKTTVAINKYSIRRSDHFHQVVRLTCEMASAAITTPEVGVTRPTQPSAAW